MLAKSQKSSNMRKSIFLKNHPKVENKPKIGQYEMGFGFLGGFKVFGRNKKKYENFGRNLFLSDGLGWRIFAFFLRENSKIRFGMLN